MRCDHKPNARNICCECGEPILYYDLGGPGAGGFWISEKDYDKEIKHADTFQPSTEWKGKTGDEIVEDIRRVLNSNE